MGDPVGGGDGTESVIPEVLRERKRNVPELLRVTFLCLARMKWCTEAVRDNLFKVSAEEKVERVSSRE